MIDRAMIDWGRQVRRWRRLRRDPIRYFEESRHPRRRRLALTAMAWQSCVTQSFLEPLRSLRCLVPALRPRRFKLLPNPDLAKTSDGWQNTGEHPRFTVRSYPALRDGGWVLVTLTVAGQGARLNPVLRAKGRDGEEMSIHLPSLLSGTLESLVLLPSRIDKVTLEPHADGDRFRIETFSLKNLTAFAVLEHLRVRDGKSLTDALRTLRQARPRLTAGRRAGQAEQRRQRAELALLRQSPLFDSTYYLDRYQDVAQAGLDPVEHYYLHGAAEGRDPGPGFETLFYLSSNSDVAGSDYNPLVHYIRYGKAEGRRPTPDEDPKAPPPKAPPETAWQGLTGRGAAQQTEPVLDVIVPVYRGLDDTLACLHAVLTAKVSTPFELVVIDDRSPEPDLSAALRKLADEGLITLLVNRRNHGFVGSVNQGMKLHPDRDVVLLNADTLVYGDWLDRLRGQALARPKTATVTPLSNNATICSYPFTDRNNRALLELDFAELDALAARVNAGQAIEVPTGVGFCFYIKRAALDQVGLFDEQSFGRGYGEENDFCRRAAKLGWSNQMAGDVFVRHTGEVSFSGDAIKARRRGMRALLRQHPDYSKLVANFIAENPAAGLRQRLDRARLARAGGGRCMLFVGHRRGGGVERHMKEMAEALAEEGVGILVLRDSPEGGAKALLNTLSELSLPNLNPIDLGRDLDELIETLRDAGVIHVHVHSLADHDPSSLKVLPEIAERLGVAYDFTAHDYLPACPRINMIDRTGVYCGEKGIGACHSCLSRDGSPFGHVEIEDWRRSYGAFLAGARAVFAPSDDVRQRLSRYFPRLDVLLRPHSERLNGPGRSLAARRGAGKPLRVAVIGAIGPHKGAKVLFDCARDAATRRLPLEFVVIGYTDRNPDLARLPNVTVTGRYQESEVYTLIEYHKCHLAFFPAVWPETYSYTLSLALAAGLHPVAFDIGAIAQRISTGTAGTLLPFDLVFESGRTNDALLAIEFESENNSKAEKTSANGRPFSSIDYYQFPSRNGDAPTAEPGLLLTQEEQ